MLAIQQVSNGMTRIHFGFTMPYGALDTVRRSTFVEDLNHALDLVAGHFDSAWSIDHLRLDANDLLEGFTTLTYMAACHPQLMFGHAVLCQSFRNPALLGQMGATLHFLSGGRFILGIGAGWDQAEYRAYGYDFPAAHTRVEQLEEAPRSSRRCGPRSGPSSPADITGCAMPAARHDPIRFRRSGWAPSGYNSTQNDVGAILK
jgi:alkanesulfonate monooxygenase SsuD/methylene tetrahydromethanopterin reductase-like flavin-dependent oxidoreductase (luciferase family)